LCKHISSCALVKLGFSSLLAFFLQFSLVAGGVLADIFFILQDGWCTKVDISISGETAGNNGRFNVCRWLQTSEV